MQLLHTSKSQCYKDSKTSCFSAKVDGLEVPRRNLFAPCVTAWNNWPESLWMALFPLKQLVQDIGGARIAGLGNKWEGRRWGTGVSGPRVCSVITRERVLNQVLEPGTVTSPVRREGHFYSHSTEFTLEGMWNMFPLLDQNVEGPIQTKAIPFFLYSSPTT